MTVLDWGSRVAVIGEVGQAHDGSLGTAHAFIDAIADAGAAGVKFQTQQPEHLVEFAVETPSASLLALRGWQSGKPAAGGLAVSLSLCLAQVARRRSLGGLSGIVVAQRGEG